MNAETVTEAAARIRAQVPITGTTATNAECAARGRLEDEALPRLGHVPGPRAWYTVQMVDGQICGQWAESAVEAELGVGIWWGKECVWCVEDTDLAVYQEYFPTPRHGRDHGRRFPVGPPRTPRARYAPADSLLDQLGPVGGWGSPVTASSGINR